MKTIFTSKTLWFGALQILLGLVGLITGMMESTEAITLITTGIGTIGFRFVTTGPISSN